MVRGRQGKGRSWEWLELSLRDEGAKDGKPHDTPGFVL